MPTDDIETTFELLASLPAQLSCSPCVAHKHEILICGYYRNNECYSYHTLKNQYKRICCYPQGIRLLGHSVVKLMSNDNPNAVTLLSFGGDVKHTLVMEYVSVWDEERKGERLGSGRKKSCNEWVPLIDTISSNPVSIGRDEDNYDGVRAVIGGSSNHLLFITYRENNIDVFNLKTLQYVKHSTFPTVHDVCYHCLVINKTDHKRACMWKKQTEMTLFCEKTGLSIVYDEQDNTFQMNKLWVCTTMRTIIKYAYVCVDNFILFFGGRDYNSLTASKAVYKYSMKDDKWTKFERTLPLPLSGCVGVLSQDHAFVHILGGDDGSDKLLTHVKTNVVEWTRQETNVEQLWAIQEEEKKDIEEVKVDVEGIEGDITIKKLKVYFFFNDFISKKKKKKKLKNIYIKKKKN
ncbi:hypothetical protein RFI_26039 [Reticulomyxa filosa]|uniref:Kelch motif family protein n=1 Tax=Reticulomyxa filosa TaxID=46433 RepID=X6MCF4_RETFI|nr:hypothetical protein RFI_26039 [Reticulomyxa filosa]|eukprot:ETO11336.1 hypothetical protein RFI_26039 [Reticulomyxa filosa]